MNNIFLEDGVIHVSYMYMFLDNDVSLLQSAVDDGFNILPQ